MNKKIYILLFICAFAFAKGQHTLTAAFNPVPGDLESYFSLNSTGLFLGSSGTSQTWNYTGISIAPGGPSTNTYVTMSSVPNSSLFPGGTIAADGGGFYSVYGNTSSKNEYLGTAQPTASNCQVYSDPIKFYPLPFSYGLSSSDSFSSTSSSYTITGTFTTTGDGTGTLLLPSTTYPNIFKLTYFVYETLNFGTSVDSYTIIQSQYYSSLSKFPVLTVGSQTSTSSGIQTYGNINAPFALGIPSAFEINGPEFFPNPVTNGELFIRNTGSDIVSVTFINTLGQSVKTIHFENTGSENTRIDVNELAKGIYFLNMESKKGLRSKKITIE
jgi:hypothetical protein